MGHSKQAESLLACPEPQGGSGALAARSGREELRADSEVVLAAVAQNGSALQFASQELRRGGAERGPGTAWLGALQLQLLGKTWLAANGHLPPQLRSLRDVIA